MMGITLFGVVLIFLSVGLNIQTAESCSCIQQHPQHHFCTSQIVILGEITRENEVVENEEDFIRYEIKIIEEFKGFNKSKRIQYVYTNQDEGMCGITLEKRRYLLSGYLYKNDGIEVNLCNLVKQWDGLSLTKQENLKQTYKMGCNCTISRCSGRQCCSQSEKKCMWNKSPQSLEYACLEDSDGICSWYRAGSKADEDAKCKPKGWSIFSFLKKIFV
ncbi:metalloproteinase inhibitor 4-like [Triplophysa dalaica]|uniref:metalloproteinase inhibitor 4-like n=1 Tax=Triplophysa dalaica TaxID=1582913 RepID=UPI0024DF9862|nr:metalloproteinase inhibitor 4-like [Triplophysa dalaica]